MQKFFIVAAAVILSSVSPVLAQSQTIYDIAAGDGNFSTLATALDLTHLDDILDCESGICRFTTFAPTDSAFAKLPSGLLDKLVTEDWEAHLRGILLYHVAYGIIGSTDISDKGSIDTIFGERLNTTVEGDSVKINDVNVVKADVKASNGVVHVIDGVLIPPFMANDVIATAQNAGIFNTLLAAVDAADLTATLQGDGPFTLFAPTDSAFETLGAAAVQSLLKDIPTLTDILTYHVIAGEIVLGSELGRNNTLTTVQGGSIDVHIWNFWFFQYVYLNDGVNILVKDILTSNGVIHVIDTVLIPTNTSLPEPTITEILEADPNFKTLSTALSTAGLSDTLNGDGPFTLFAPTNAAFDALGAETIAALLADPKGLSEILTYHVVAGEVYSDDLTSGAVETVNGADLIVDVGFFHVYLNGNTYVVHVDQKASNGVIHTIDSVLIPPAGDCLAVAAANGLDSFVAAVKEANLTKALSDPNGTFTIFAPTNAAFDALSGVNLPVDTLTTVLTYHVLPEVTNSDDLSDGDGLTTLEGSSIEVSFNYFLWIFFDGIYLDEKAKIVATDLLCTNGVIHIIDKVLLPPSVSL